MKLNSLTLVFVAILALAIPTACKKPTVDAAPSVAAALAQNMIGTWVHVGTPGHVREIPEKGQRLKMRTGTHWALTRADSETGLVVEHFGGTYTMNGDEYVETQTFGDATWMKDNGTSWTFKVKVEGDTMTQIGVGNPYTEVWKRAK